MTNTTIRTTQDLIAYEREQYRKAFSEGTDEAWARYWANIRRAVKTFNESHSERADADLLTYASGWLF